MLIRAPRYWHARCFAAFPAPCYMHTACFAMFRAPLYKHSIFVTVFRSVRYRRTACCTVFRAPFYVHTSCCTMLVLRAYLLFHIVSSALLDAYGAKYFTVFRALCCQQPTNQPTKQPTGQKGHGTTVWFLPACAVLQGICTCIGVSKCM
jgi:hypothetical protein